jgi:hypothetical protein
MFLASMNKPQRLICMSYIDLVTPEQLARNRNDVLAMLAEMPPGFRLLADFSHLKSMDVDCVTEIGAMMERLDRAGIGTVVRVLPDESKDIGMKILSIFHYQHRPDIVTCQNMTEAVRVLEL